MIHNEVQSLTIPLPPLRAESASIVLLLVHPPLYSVPFREGVKLQFSRSEPILDEDLPVVVESTGMRAEFLLPPHKENTATTTVSRGFRPFGVQGIVYSRRTRPTTVGLSFVLRFELSRTTTPGARPSHSTSVP